MQAQYRKKCDEEAGLRVQLEIARLEVQQIRLRLHASGVKDGESLIPASLKSGGGRKNAETCTAEHRSLLEWLAEVVDLSRQTVFHAPGEVHIGEHKVPLGRMVQWHISTTAAGSLKLSVPRDLETEITALLSRARRRILGNNELWQIREDWELLGADVASEGETHPAIFLVHRTSAQAVVVASWPTLTPAFLAGGAPPLPDAAAPRFDAAAYFGAHASATAQMPMSIRKVVFVDEDGDVSSLIPNAVPGGAADSCSLGRCTGCGIEWALNDCERRRVEEFGVYFDAIDRCTLTGPFGSIVVAEPKPGPEQRELVRHLLYMASEQGISVTNHCDCPPRSKVAIAKPTDSSCGSASASAPTTCRAGGIAHVQAGSQLVNMSTGDHVEVEFEGEWFSGVLQGVEGDVAHVKCDVDEPSVITLAHVSSVRPAAQQRHRRTHMRSRSKPCP